MAKITKKQYDSWNEMLGNGFVFDLRYFAIHHEKTCLRNIPLDTDDLETSKSVLQVHLMYREEYKNVTNEYGCSYNVPTGMHIPCMHLALYRVEKETGVGVSSGLGHWVNLGEPQSKMLYSTLAKLTNTTVTHDFIMRYYDKYYVQRDYREDEAV